MFFQALQRGDRDEPLTWDFAHRAINTEVQHQLLDYLRVREGVSLTLLNYEHVAQHNLGRVNEFAL